MTRGATDRESRPAFSDEINRDRMRSDVSCEGLMVAQVYPRGSFGGRYYPSDLTISLVAMLIG